MTYQQQIYVVTNNNHRSIPSISASTPYIQSFHSIPIQGIQIPSHQIIAITPNSNLAINTVQLNQNNHNIGYNICTQRQLLQTMQSIQSTPIYLYNYNYSNTENNTSALFVNQYKATYDTLMDLNNNQNRLNPTNNNLNLNHNQHTLQYSESSPLSSPSSATSVSYIDDINRNNKIPTTNHQPLPTKKDDGKNNLLFPLKKSRNYLCCYCGRAFKQSHSLKDHIRTHTGEKPYDCNYCGRAFKVKYNMIVHRRIHTGVKPYSCEVCNKRYASKSGYNAHVKKHHPMFWKNKQK